MWDICDQPYPNGIERRFLPDASPDPERPTCYIQNLEGNKLRTLLYFIDGLSVVITGVSVVEAYSKN